MGLGEIGQVSRLRARIDVGRHPNSSHCCSSTKSTSARSLETCPISPRGPGSSFASRSWSWHCFQLYGQHKHGHTTIGDRERISTAPPLPPLFHLLDCQHHLANRSHLDYLDPRVHLL